LRRGDLYLADLDPSRGSEARKTRPVILVSNDAANRAAQRGAAGVVTVVPITSSTDRVFPFHVLLPGGTGTGLRVESKAQAEQVRAISVSRLMKGALGRVPDTQMAALDAALRLHLALQSGAPATLTG